MVVGHFRNCLIRSRSGDGVTLTSPTTNSNPRRTIQPHPKYRTALELEALRPGDQNVHMRFGCQFPDDSAHPRRPEPASHRTSVFERPSAPGVILNSKYPARSSVPSLPSSASVARSAISAFSQAGWTVLPRISRLSWTLRRPNMLP